MSISNTRKRETCVLGGASCIRSHVLKFQAMCSLSPHLAIFHPHALSRSSITLETITTPLPPAILDPSPGACRCLVPGPGARHCSWSSRPCAALGHCHAATVVDPDPASLRACRHPRPQPYLPQSVLLPSSSSSPRHGL
jgi:hypothetical protein